MDLKHLHDQITAKMETGRNSAFIALMLSADPDLRSYSDHRELLAFLGDRSLTGSRERVRVVRALLRNHQQGTDTAFGELLFLAYHPVLCRLVGSLRRHVAGTERDERSELVVAAFFEAATKVPLGREDAPTSVSLALKTRQLATREALRRKYKSENEVEWEEEALEHPSPMTPERVMTVHDAEEALASCGELLLRLLNTTCENASVHDLTNDATWFSQLRSRFPELSERHVKRLYDRACQRRRRLIASIRERTKDSLSEIHDYLDLLG